MSYGPERKMSNDSRENTGESISHHEIREKFVSFFEKKGHLLIPNSSLIPDNDPTLLIVNSGMAPIKKYFTGEETPSSRRLTNIQRCLRTNDIESVGDASHLTFFEMMGNWSIGDYFKEDALRFAYELLVDVFQFDKNKLHVSVYGGDKKYPDIPPDTEAYDIWQKLGILSNRIHKMGAEDNFWGPAGTSGPCGPASEVHFDLGENVGCKQHGCNLSHGCGRFLEIWNPGVFMQYNKSENGTFTKLPFNSVDAGAGIERFAMVLQKADSVYDTDLLKPITQAFFEENSLPGTSAETDRSARIITDHLRSTTFMIGDGIYPGNKEREYVVRRLIRRIVANSRLMGLGIPAISQSVGVVLREFGNYYPHLVANKENITSTLNSEIKRFAKTLDQSFKVLERIIRKMDKRTIMSGEDAFMLQDSYGLPLEILEPILVSRGIDIDKEGFKVEMLKQKERSRSSREL